ncbi:integumentary mucin A.1-like [Haliotis cracherodii]|uniref:integumentary mucin A.1-like n=1 Tax=Haliotis cracherodii TaxID=6455 RepID=UPI0039E75AFA
MLLMIPYMLVMVAQGHGQNVISGQLVSGVFQETRVPSFTLCQSLCWHFTPCRSSTWATGTGLCQLSRDTRNTSPASFSVSQHHVYSDAMAPLGLNFDHPCASRPCPVDEVCVPTEAATSFLCLYGALSTDIPSASTTPDAVPTTVTTDGPPTIATTTAATTTVTTTASPTTVTITAAPTTVTTTAAPTTVTTTAAQTPVTTTEAHTTATTTAAPTTVTTTAAPTTVTTTAALTSVTTTATTTTVTTTAATTTVTTTAAPTTVTTTAAPNSVTTTGSPTTVKTTAATTTVTTTAATTTVTTTGAPTTVTTTAAPTTIMTAATTTETNSCVSECVGLIGSFHSCSGGCDEYVVCSVNGMFPKNCSSGTVWDDNSKLCNFPPSPTCS